MSKTDPEVSYTNQVSISPTFYARIFRTKKLQSQNLSRKRLLYEKNASKMLMKLIADCGKKK